MSHSFLEIRKEIFEYFYDYKNITYFSVFLALGFYIPSIYGARCSSVVRAFAHGAMGRRIDPSWGGPIELFLFAASAPRLV